MKIGIPRYRERIAPRFGFTEDVLILELDGNQVVGWEVIRLDGYFPHQIPALLHQKGVEVVITGGINSVFQEMFRALDMEVFWGLIGTPEDGLKAYLGGVPADFRGACRGRRLRRGQNRSRPVQ